ncbi:MAG: dihydroorotate dehydrogenase electron transfer subunit [Chloroflexi bacterium]|nr:dihydroorotate dehydrogenase electron transfer subunit [Chloroflexota bacterium]
MKQVVASVIAKGEPITGLVRPHGRSIRFSQTIRLKCPEIAREAQPGQFVMVCCDDECVLPRPFSIHRVNDQGDVSLYFAVLEDGKGTDWLSQRQVGDAVALFGPLGNGFSIRQNSQKLLLVAGGMGIAPLYFLAEETLKKGCSVTLLYGTAVRNWYVESLLTSGIKLIIATEDGSVGYHGMITDLLPDYIDWADQIFACGPMAMYRDMAQKKRELKLQGKSVQVSLEIVMACGRGVCYGCTIKTRQGMKKVCQDGPVFDLDDILWDELNQS